MASDETWNVTWRNQVLTHVMLPILTWYESSFNPCYVTNLDILWNMSQIFNNKIGWLYLLWFVLRWGVYGTKLRFQFASWQCGWGFWCLWQFSGSPASPLEIVNVQSVDEVLTSKPVGPWDKYMKYTHRIQNQVVLYFVWRKVLISLFSFRLFSFGLT